MGDPHRLGGAGSADHAARAGAVRPRPHHRRHSRVAVGRPRPLSSALRAVHIRGHAVRAHSDGAGIAAHDRGNAHQPRTGTAAGAHSGAIRSVTMATSSDERQPLISCILPTYNRRGFLPHAIQYFLRQDYAHKELVVIDDGPDAVGDLMPADPRIRYIRLPQKITLGAKLNLCCAEARGPIIAQWDDDDWYGRDRLTRQMQALQRTNADVCGISDLLYYDVRRGTGHRYIYPPQERPWLLGASLFFRRELWERIRFVEVDVGMDALFVWATPAEKVCALPEPRFAVHLIHSDNISPKSPQGAWWSDHPVGDIADVLGEDWQYYVSDGQGLSCPRPRPPMAPVAPAEEVRVEVFALEDARPAPRARNVYACLVHESRECVIDLCRNLRTVDQESTILL